MSEPYWVPLSAQPVDYEGVWAAGTAYAPGDVVRHNGVDYLAVNPSTGQTPPSAFGPVLPLAVLSRDASDVEVVSRVDEVTVFSYLVPGGTVGPTGRLKVEVIGDARGTSSVGGVLTSRVKLGATTIYQQAPADYVNNTVRTGYRLAIEIVNRGAQNAQLVFGLQSDSGPDTGGETRFSIYQIPGTFAVDMSIDQLLAVTWQWSVGNATNSARKMLGEVSLT